MAVNRGNPRRRLPPRGPRRARAAARGNPCPHRTSAGSRRPARRRPLPACAPPSRRWPGRPVRAPPRMPSLRRDGACARSMSAESPPARQHPPPEPAVKWRITLGMLAAVITGDEIRGTYDTIRPYIRRTPVVQVDLGELDPACLAPAGRHPQTGATAVRRVVQGPRRVRQPAAAGRPAGRSRGAFGGNHGVAVAYAAHRRGVPANNLRAHRVRTGQGGAHPAARRGARGHRRPVRGRAGRCPGLGGEFGCDERARFRPAGDPARPGHPGPGAGRAGGCGGHRACAGRRRRADRRHRRLLRLHRAGHRGRADRRAYADPRPRRGPADAPAEGGSAADALAPRRVGELVFPITQAYVEDVVLVDDASILAAQRALWQATRIAAEPAASVGIAALSRRRLQARAR